MKIRIYIYIGTRKSTDISRKLFISLIQPSSYFIKYVYIAVSLCFHELGIKVALKFFLIISWWTRMCMASFPISSGNETMSNMAIYLLIYCRFTWVEMAIKGMAIAVFGMAFYWEIYRVYIQYIASMLVSITNRLFSGQHLVLFLISRYWGMSPRYQAL